MHMEVILSWYPVNDLEAAAILGVSEPLFRHRLSAERSTMIQAYDGLCQLINKTGACWQCRGIRQFAGGPSRPGVAEREILWYHCVRMEAQ